MVSVIETALPHVVSIPPYRAGKQVGSVVREYGIAEKDIVKLASNENPLGMSPKASEALKAHDFSRYPDLDCVDLRMRIAEQFSLTASNVLVGCGSSQIIELLAQAFVGRGRSLVYSQYAFAVYPLAALWVGGNPIEVPARGFAHDLQAMLDAITSDVKLVFIASPNNPTGTLLTESEIEKFLAAVPPDVIVGFDEAYGEYVDRTIAPDVTRLLQKFPNLVVMRTFSKIHGLAGLRVGYALANSDIVDILGRVQSPFSVSSTGLVAALASLDDKEFVQASVTANQQENKRLCREFERLGVEYVPSSGNFILMKVGDGAALYGKMLAQGVITRPVANYGLNEFLRVSIGLPKENDRFLEVFEGILSGAVA